MLGSNPSVDSAAGMAGRWQRHLPVPQGSGGSRPQLRSKTQLFWRNCVKSWGRRGKAPAGRATIRDALAVMS